MKYFFDILVFTISGIILLTHIVLSIGIFRIRITEKKQKKRYRKVTNTISVIVPAKDEEQTLPLCLQSLDRQSIKNFELILVNDRSTDNTLKIMSDYRRLHPGSIKVINLTENQDKINPKQYALTKGIEVSTGAVLLFTDSDCIVPASWVEEMALHFEDPAIGIVTGTIHTIPGTTFLSKYQAFDHVFRYFYTAATAGLSSASGGFGNNLAIRRKALSAIGGYESIKPSVTEDATLIAAVRNHSKYKIQALTSVQIKVLTSPLNDWKALRSQELRWSTGAIFAPDSLTRWGYRIIMLYLALGVLPVPFIFLWPVLAVLTTSSFSSMLLIAVLAGLFSRMELFGYWVLLLPHICFSMVYYLYITLLTFLHVPLEWKGNKLIKI
ncbi:MAG: glycosyltransferase [Spirochaetota bacterium]